jgi:hypothetical protein
VKVADYRGVSKVANALLRRATGRLEREHSGNGVDKAEGTTRGWKEYIDYMTACGYCCGYGALQPVVVRAKLQRSR